jgi:hypothetical protein
LRIGERRFTTDQLMALRQSILDDMHAFGAGTAKSFGQYFKEIPTLDALAARLGRGLP